VPLDIGLPILNGYEAARKIQEQAWGKGVVLIALTGWGQEEDRRSCIEAGSDTGSVTICLSLFTRSSSKNF
jgi:DNA-binding response OmpR family regulator